MRIRTQLILAAFVLAVVPLAAIVIYTHHSSRRALEAAYRSESDRLTKQMDRRLAAIRAELDQRLAVVSALPLPTTTDADAGSIATVMGEAASFVDAIEFHPVRVPAPPREAAEPATRPEVEVAEAPPAPEPPEPMIIDLPAIALPKYLMSEEQTELIAEIGKLGGLLGNQSLDEEERADVRKEIQAAQEELRRVVSEDREAFQKQIQDAVRVRSERQELLVRAREEARERQRQAKRVAPTPSVAVVPAPVPTPAVAAVAPVQAAPMPQIRIRHVTQKDVEKAVDTAKKTSLILGRKFQAPVRSEGELVGQLTARISPDQVIRRILGSAEDGSEIPFALDREGTVYTRTPAERARLDGLGIPERVRKGQPLSGIEGWIVTTSVDPQSGLRIGVARPVGESLGELRRTAARNFSLGLGLIVFALIGIVPLSNHLTRDVKLVTDGAERIAQGDLMTRLPVKTKNELGQLARAFNRMAEDLSHQQERLLQQERARKEQELQQRLMAVEYERKSVELEDARRFQLSMLPKEVPRHDAYEVAVYTRTATEVGGDYYDFHVEDDALAVTIGDATGHGAKAGTMVTVIKTLFAGYGGATSPAAFLGDAAEKIKRMDLGRMAMALSLARFEGRGLTVSSAGMPPVLVHRRQADSVQEIAIGATPLGTLGITYEETAVDLAAGDTVLFMSDGFPELMNHAGQQLGYAATLDAFAEAAHAATTSAVIESLAAFAARWHGDAAPNDDVTFVVVRMR